eukprot:gnl/TRDRNA2_/TRDRNA2_65110_c0_seq1.p1 gnl/TRDRNA2_/TRDRNA2_65110_c0~~gnl/TRDRNA2_/TRDRNA2_65110_c0_seq1.p1  ORF type:complete len:163 (-),score=34.38 gnl/TRDRNA2_/TRDRNA2_65110_c0_seq1:34-522(-)
METAWQAQAKKAGVSLDFGVKTQWQPIASQRVMIFASKSGRQEAYIEALNRRHFMQGQSASHRNTVLDSAEEAGLDREEVAKFLDTNELEADVWESYRATVEDKGVHSIPLFVFNVAGMTDGGPFRSGSGRHWTIKGAQGAEVFLQVFREAVEAACEKKGGC